MINAIMTYIRGQMQAALIDNVDEEDPTRAGRVKIGPYQGDPTPDEGRITISIHENDPDQILKTGVGKLDDEWSDDVNLVECGGAMTMTRRFTIKARCLFVTTRENEDTARSIASTVRGRIETTLKKMSFSSVRTADEYVARGVLASDLRAEQVQAGGPPDAFDYLIKVHFSVLTTQTGLLS
jgi:hypothetical protein